MDQEMSKMKLQEKKHKGGKAKDYLKYMST